MFSNARQYNVKGSMVVEDADYLEKHVLQKKLAQFAKAVAAKAAKAAKAAAVRYCSKARDDMPCLGKPGSFLQCLPAATHVSRTL